MQVYEGSMLSISQSLAFFSEGGGMMETTTEQQQQQCTLGNRVFSLFS